MTYVAPIPPLKGSFLEMMRAKVDESHHKMNLPLDVFQASFYSALGFASFDRLITLVQSQQINIYVGYSAAAFAIFISIWLTVKYVLLLGDIIIIRLASILPESMINETILLRGTIVIVFLIAMFFNIAFAVNANCALLNECGKPTGVLSKPFKF